MAAILLTGATGFLGSNILKRFLQEGREVIVLKRSFSNTWRIEQDIKQAHVYDIDRVDLETVFVNHDIGVVVHTATNYGRKGQSAVQILQDNVLFPLTVLELSQQQGVATFLNTDTLLHRQLNAYATSKQQFVVWGRRLAEQKGTSFINMKLEHMYGPGDDDTKFVTWILRQLLQDVEYIPLTAGGQKRDFVHVDDVVEAYWTVLQHNRTAPYSEYEVGCGTSVSIKDMVECAKSQVEHKLSRLLRTQLRFGEVPTRIGEPDELCANIAELKKAGWKPGFRFKDGLQSTIDHELS